MRVIITGLHFGTPDDGYFSRPWMTEEHIDRMRSVSDELDISFLSRQELEGHGPPDPAPEILLMETTGKDKKYDDTYPDMIPGSRLQELGLLTPALRWVQAASAGTEHLEGVFPDSVTVTNGAGVYADPIAETVLAGLLSRAKRLPERLEYQKRHEWKKLPNEELQGKVMCILGVGGIGTAIAQLGQAFGMSVIGIRRHVQTTPYVDRVVGPTDLHDVLGEADYVIVASPLTLETEHLIGREEFLRMKRGAYLVVVSRGGVVVESDMFDALNEGHLGGALLDAHTEEPLPADHPAWSAPGVTIIPHDANSSPRHPDRLTALFTDNLRRYLNGQQLRNVVDPKLGY